MMTPILVLNIFIELIVLATIVTFIIIKRKSGKSLIKIKNYDFILFCALGIVFFGISAYMAFLKVNKGFIIVAATMLFISIYCISCSIIIRNSVCEKGIVILNNFPFFIKWSDIQRFGINGKIIYFENKKGYASIKVSDKNIKHIEEILSAKIKKEVL